MKNFFLKHKPTLLGILIAVLFSASATFATPPTYNTLDPDCLPTDPGCSIAFTTTNITEGANVYFTDARARSALSLTTTGASGSATYNSTTGVFNIPTYTLAGLGGISLTSLSATGPLSYSNTTGVFSITQATTSQSGFLSSTDWNTFNNKQNALTNPVTGTGTSGQIAFWDGTNTTTGTNNLFWDNVNNRLGIGITSPQRELQVNVSPNATRGILVTDNNDTTKSVIISSSNGATAMPYIGTNGNQRLDLGVNGGRTMTLDTNSSVGINTTAPFTGVTGAIGLDIGVFNTAGAEGNLMVRGYASLGGVSRGSYGAVGSNYYLNGNTLTRRFADFASILQFDSGGFQFLTGTNGTAGSTITTTELARMLANGNFLIGGTTDGGFKLDVTGTFRSSGTATIGGNIALTGGVKISFATGGGFIEGADTYLRFATNAGTERMRIDSLGNVGIGLSTPTNRLSVVGIVGDTTVMNISTTGGNTCSFSTTAGTWSCASDRNLKKDITSLTATDTLTKLRLITPVTFKYNWQQDTESPIPGFIAQDFETVFPSLVSTDPTTGYKSLSYAPLVPYLVKGLQEMDIQLTAITPDALDATAYGKIKEFLRGIAVEGKGIFATVQTKKLCVDDVCVTRDEFKQMLDASRGTNSSQGGGAPTSEQDSDTVTENIETGPQIETPTVAETPQSEPLSDSLE